MSRCSLCEKPIDETTKSQLTEQIETLENQLLTLQTDDVDTIDSVKIEITSRKRELGKLCSNSSEHAGKWQISELLKQLKQCDPSEESGIIDQIKAIEESLNLEEKYRVDFTAPNVVEKFDLEVIE